MTTTQEHELAESIVNLLHDMGDDWLETLAEEERQDFTMKLVLLIRQERFRD
jgi:hypothetical protein